ncbi:FtsB family cell division protein [Oceanobacillus jeddahense]|uniref:Septum formation initiator family protein n=1 Tax=Oceanobacillus jeddahense TaxID=1462527 RepID=A0ABY5JSB6_9BACI|nr:septum formation initiator family protein [Oceanobacillus jeddahense]UUI03230.1 septum formation initiator family protein [Oceanobacillus jeddahense]
MEERKKKVTKLQSKSVHQYDAYIERQNRKKQRLTRRLLLYALVVAVIVGSMSIYHFSQRATQADKMDEYEQLEQQLADLKQEESNLNNEIELLQDEDYVLEIARTNYFFSNEGELIFKLPDEDPSY